MVGKRIDEILAVKAISNVKRGNSYFAPIVVPVVSGFKRLYKTRLSKNTVFRGKPLHTIEESTETAQLELNPGGTFVWNRNITFENNQEDDDVTLLQIRNLFELPDNGDLEDNEDRTFLDRSMQDGLSPDVSYLASPSFSLIQQFENAAKVEAATCIQRWYRQVRDRQRFLEIRNAAIIIQRCFRQRR